jgi:hypothetical protein
MITHALLLIKIWEEEEDKPQRAQREDTENTEEDIIFFSSLCTL